MNDELKEELEELVAEQKDRVRQYETFTDPHMRGLAKGYQQCAEQLETLIERYDYEEKPKGDLKDADGVFVESGELYLKMEWLRVDHYE